MSRSARASVGLVAEDKFSCALTAASGVECWGSNEYGALGIDDLFTEDYSADPLIVLPN